MLNVISNIIKDFVFDASCHQTKATIPPLTYFIFLHRILISKENMTNMIKNVSCTLEKYILQFIQIQLTLRGENNLCCGWLPVDQLLAAAVTTSSAPNGRTNNKYFLLEPISISCWTQFTDMFIWNGIGPVSFISTEGAFKRPMTYDNHPIHPSIHPSIPSHPATYSIEDDLSRTKINYDFCPVWLFKCLFIWYG